MRTLERAPAPARRSRPPRTGFSKLLLVLGVGVAAFLLFLPARQLVGQQQRIHRLESRLEALQRENQELSAEVERLSDPEELELIARERFGLVEPGERLYAFTPTPTPEPTPEPRAEDGEPIWSRAWSWLVSLVRGDG